MYWILSNINGIEPIKLDIDPLIEWNYGGFSGMLSIYGLKPIFGNRIWKVWQMTHAINAHQSMAHCQMDIDIENWNWKYCLSIFWSKYQAFFGPNSLAYEVAPDNGHKYWAHNDRDIMDLFLIHLSMLEFRSAAVYGVIQ